MESINKIWIPQLIFSNTLDLSSIKVDLYSSLTIQRQGEPSLLPPADLTENYIFKGSENPLMYNDTYDLSLHCNFLLVNYPFDTQKCTIQVIMTHYKLLGYVFKNILMIIFVNFSEHTFFENWYSQNIHKKNTLKFFVRKSKYNILRKLISVCSELSLGYI